MNVFRCHVAFPDRLERRKDTIVTVTTDGAKPITAPVGDLAGRFLAEVSLNVADVYVPGGRHGFRFAPNDVVYREIRCWIERAALTSAQIGVYLDFCAIEPYHFYRPVKSPDFKTIHAMQIEMLVQVILVRVRRRYRPSAPMDEEE